MARRIALYLNDPANSSHRRQVCIMTRAHRRYEESHNAKSLIYTDEVGAVTQVDLVVGTKSGESFGSTMFMATELKEDAPQLERLSNQQTTKFSRQSSSMARILST